MPTTSTTASTPGAVAAATASCSVGSAAPLGEYAGEKETLR
jgi:hypothetical protein